MRIDESVTFIIYFFFVFLYDIITNDNILLIKNSSHLYINKNVIVCIITKIILLNQPIFLLKSQVFSVHGTKYMLLREIHKRVYIFFTYIKNNELSVSD